jgi:hypothetical protein
MRYPCIDHGRPRFRQQDRRRNLLLWTDADNPVRFVDAFVDELDLAAAGVKRVTRKVTREVTLPHL